MPKEISSSGPDFSPLPLNLIAPPAMSSLSNVAFSENEVGKLTSSSQDILYPRILIIPLRKKPDLSSTFNDGIFFAGNREKENKYKNDKNKLKKGKSNSYI